MAVRRAAPGVPVRSRPVDGGPHADVHGVAVPEADCRGSPTGALRLAAGPAGGDLQRSATVDGAGRCGRADRLRSRTGVSVLSAPNCASRSPGHCPPAVSDDRAGARLFLAPAPRSQLPRRAPAPLEREVLDPKAAANGRAGREEPARSRRHGMGRDDLPCCCVHAATRVHMGHRPSPAGAPRWKRSAGSVSLCLCPSPVLPAAKTTILRTLL